MKFEIKERLADNDSRNRSRRGQCTPAGDLFGGSSRKVEKTFRVMAIDIHYIESGRIRKTYHMETGSRRCCSCAHEVNHFLEELTMSTNGKPGIVFAHGLG